MLSKLSLCSVLCLVRFFGDSGLCGCVYDVRRDDFGSLSWGHGLLSRGHDLLSKSYAFLSRGYDLLSMD